MAAGLTLTYTERETPTQASPKRIPMRILVSITAALLLLAGAPGARAGGASLDWQVDYRQVRMDDLGRQLITPEFMSLSPEVGTQYEQYDARILYPVRQSGLRLDFGLHLRHIEGFARRLGTEDPGHPARTSLNETIPSFYASALFDLPFEGLSAGFEGTRSGFSDRLLDYRASLQYQWHNGLGLQGGWQHQQFTLDPDLDTGPVFTNYGPYLDINWQF